VFDRFLGMDQHGIGRIRALGSAVAGGHLKVYTTDPSMQKGLALAHADGAFAAPQGDMVSVVVNSRSGSKVDYYAHRTVDYDVVLGGDGEAFGTTSVAIRNDAPDHGLPGFVIDPLADGEPGDNIALITVSCPDPCDLIEAQRNGKDQGMRVGSELGFPWYQDFFTIPSGQTGTLRLVTKRGGVWEGNSSGGSYRLTMLTQTTVQPTDVSVTIHAPEGTRITWTSEDMQVDGGTAVWRGTPGPRLELEVRFSAPLPLRWWRDVSRALPF
jgi:hypothetical protein